MRSENPKQQAIVSKGKELFWKYGIRKVSIEEICKEAGVSKTTYLKYFSNKNELVIHIIEALQSEQMKAYKAFWESDISMEEKVQMTIRLKLESTNSMSMDFIKDVFTSGDSELTEYFNIRTQEALDQVRYDYREAQEKGLLRDDISIDFIIYFLNHMGEMIMDQKLISLYADSSDMLRDLMEVFYYGVMPKKK